MNYKLVVHKLGSLILLFSFFMASSLVWIVQDYKQDPTLALKTLQAFILSVVISVVIGAGLFLIGRREKNEMFHKEALAVTGLGWILVGLIGALPYLLSGVLVSQYAHASERIAASIFESVSGFTTTGASMLTDIESLPRTLLYWRSLTHWLGGIGIVVFFVALLGTTGTANKYLFNSETSKMASGSTEPRIRQAALLLLKIYLGLSLLQFFVLRFLGMNTFESLCHTYGTMATGGFSPLNQSIGQYHSLKFEITIIVFMILAGINFNSHALLVQGQWKTFYRNREVRVFLIIMLLVALVITGNLLLQQPDRFTFGRALREAVFQTVSCMTCTGYSTADFTQWPVLSRWLLITLMIVGGSAGSTSGGLKVIRIMLLGRIVLYEIERTFRPAVFRSILINKQPIDQRTIYNVSIFVMVYLLALLVFPIFLIGLQNFSSEPHQLIDMVSAFSAVISCMGGVGPGLKLVGPMANYHFMVPAAKLLLCLVMYLGRLEVMAFLCLFLPSFWRRD